MAELMFQLRSTVLLRDGAVLTDGQLLEEYVSYRDEAALAALVRRHADMVWGVCRRVLSNYHDAEDAFQATFHVLVRKAASVRPRELVANWLYGVANQTARKAKATACTRKGRENQVAELPEPVVTETAPDDELRPVLDEELSRLPEKYRAVIVLCDLEGKTRKEAARQLGVPEGTVAGWVARARARLSERLTRRGITLPAVALATAFARSAMSASAPVSVVLNTIKSAGPIAAGHAAGLISAKVAALTEGVLKAMYATQLKVVLSAVLLLGAVACTGAGLSLMQTAEAESPAKVKPGFGPGIGKGAGEGAPPISDKKAVGAVKAKPGAEPRSGKGTEGPTKVKPGVGPGFGEGAGEGATPISGKKAGSPTKVKTGAAPGFGKGADGPAKVKAGAEPVPNK